MNTDAKSGSSIKSVFLAALRLPDAEARGAFLDEACGDNLHLRNAVRDLLAARERTATNPLDQAVDRLYPTQGVSPRGVPSLDLAAHSVIGPYKLLEQLGEGGMGTVFMAEQKEPVRRKVALKLIKPGMDSQEVIARFEAERQALALMDHPNIARIYDAGTTALGHPYFVMELVRGVPVDQYCDEVTLSIRERLALFIDICGAVQHAHQKGIIHRDLKPSNILVTLHDSVPVPKVIDFGIAKALDQELTNRTLFTRFAQLVGTPVYMSPEQAELSGLDIDTRSDIYSLGVMLYELLVGVKPFDEGTLKSVGLDEMRRIIREDNPVRPSQRVATLKNDVATTVSYRRKTETSTLRLSLRRELDWIVMKALEKDRSRRYGTVNELSQDVQRYLADEPVQACPPSAGYLLGKWVQRHRLMVGTGVVLAAALLLTCTISLWQIREVRKAWHESRQRERQVSDLLEAAHLLTGTRAFRNSDLNSLAELSSRMSLAVRGSGTPDVASDESLGQLLQGSARPLPCGSLGPAGAIDDFDISADGSRLASISADGEVRLWDLATSSSRVLGTHDEPASAIALSPDGRSLVSGSSTGHVWFWDIDSGQVTLRIKPLTTGIETLLWSPDGRYVAAGARYSETWIGDARGKEYFRIKNDHRHEALLFTPDSKRLLVPTRTNIDVWLVETAKKVKSHDVAPLSNVRAMCWAGRDGQWLIAGERFLESLVILHRDTGKQLGTITTGVLYAQHLAASSDGKWLAAAYRDGRIQLIELVPTAMGQVSGVVRLQLAAHDIPPEEADDARATVLWRPDTCQFVSAAGDGPMQWWDLEAIRPARQLAVSNSPPLKCVYPRDADELVGIMPDDRLVRLDYAGNAQSSPTTAPSFEARTHSRLAAQGLIAVADEDQIGILSLDTLQLLSTIPSPFGWPRAVALSPDATTLAAGSSDQLGVWRTGNRWKTYERVRLWDCSMETYSLLFADGGRTLLADDRRKSIVEWDWESGRILQKHTMPLEVAGCCLSSRSDLLAAATDDGIQVIDRRTPEVTCQLKCSSTLSSLVFSGDDRVLISGHADGKLRAWHLPTGQELGDLYSAHQSLGVSKNLIWQHGRLLAWYRADRSSTMVVLGAAGFPQPSAEMVDLSPSPHRP